MKKVVVVVMFVLAEDIKLPDSVKFGGIGVLDAIYARQSARYFELSIIHVAALAPSLGKRQSEPR